MLDPKYASPGSSAKTCPNCSLDVMTDVVNCPRCGIMLQKVSTLRILGIIQVLLGMFLMAVIGVLSVVIFNIVRNADDPTATTRFTGSRSDVLFIICVFGVVFLVGFTSFAAGMWQIIYGKRNKYIIKAVVAFGLIFMLIGIVVSFLS